MRLALAAVLAFAASPALAQGWAADPAASSLTLTGKQGDYAYTATLTGWNAAITFDPANLAAATIRAEIPLTALTLSPNAEGEEGYLKGASWFDVKNHPGAVLECPAGSVAAAPTGYTAACTLAIRGEARPVTLAFTVVIDGNSATAEGTAPIDWTQWPLPVKDANPSWGVDPAVTAAFRIVAAKS